MTLEVVALGVKLRSPSVVQLIPACSLSCGLVGCLYDLLEPGLHLTPSCSVLNPEPDKKKRRRGSSPRQQRQAVSFMAVFRVRASLSARPGPGFCKPFTVKRPEEGREPPLFHSSEPYICFLLLSRSDSLSVALLPDCLCVSSPPSFS